MNAKKFLIASALVLIAPLFARAEQHVPIEDFNPKLFSEIQSVSKKILKHYDPKKTVFIGLGRSPTPFMAYMSLSPNIDTRFLPLSGLSVFSTFYKADEIKFDSEDFSVLGEHLQKFLGELQGKDIVLLDMGITGQSLLYAMELVKSFLQKEGRTNTVKGHILLTHTIPPELERKAFVYKKDLIITKIPTSMELFHHLHWQHFDSYAPYGSFHPDSRKPISEPDFSNFEKLRQRLRLEFETQGGSSICSRLFNLDS